MSTSKISTKMFVDCLYWQLLFYSILNNSIEKLLCTDLFSTWKFTMGPQNFVSRIWQISRFQILYEKWTFKDYIVKVFHWDQKDSKTLCNFKMNLPHCVIPCWNLMLTGLQFSATYSRVRIKRSPTIINFLTFFQGLRPYSGLHSIR